MAKHPHTHIQQLQSKGKNHLACSSTSTQIAGRQIQKHKLWYCGRVHTKNPFTIHEHLQYVYGAEKQHEGTQLFRTSSKGA